LIPIWCRLSRLCSGRLSLRFAGAPSFCPADRLTRCAAVPLPRFPAVFSRLPNHRHGLRHRNGGAGLDDVLEQRPAGAGHQLHHCLVGLDLSEDIADRNRLALLLFPLDQTPLFHGGREGLHDDLCGH
jgi:hypothetical protein